MGRDLSSQRLVRRAVLVGARHARRRAATRCRSSPYRAWLRSAGQSAGSSTRYDAVRQARSADRRRLALFRARLRNRHQTTGARQLQLFAIGRRPGDLGRVDRPWRGSHGQQRQSQPGTVAASGIHSPAARAVSRRLLCEAMGSPAPGPWATSARGRCAGVDGCAARGLSAPRARRRRRRAALLLPATRSWTGAVLVLRVSPDLCAGPQPRWSRDGGVRNTHRRFLHRLRPQHLLDADRESRDVAIVVG